MPTALIVLAAGQGTRMQSDRPKALHRIAGASLLEHAIRSAEPLSPDRTVVVVGHGGDEVAREARAIDPATVIATQKEQLGTGDAVMAARAALEGFDGDALVLFCDTPFIRAKTLKSMQASRETGADLVVLGFKPEDPGKYGRLVSQGDKLIKIVEWKDASEKERDIKLCNSGLILANARTLFDLLAHVKPSPATGEYYLTDIAGIVHQFGGHARIVLCDEDETQGINTREDLARAEAGFQDKARAEALAAGITLQAPETVHFAHDTVIGRDTVIEPFVVFGPGVSVENGATIRAFSHIEGAHIGQGATVGPYARLRPGAEIGGGARVGNFVEVKASEIGEGAKVNHLSYIGDASVGAGSNVGAGTITCNYDGVMKHRTEIGENVFIGSNTMLIAPVTVGDEAMTASGSVINRDVEAGALAISRAPQEVKPGWARRFFKNLKALKARRKGE